MVRTGAPRVLVIGEDEGRARVLAEPLLCEQLLVMTDCLHTVVPRLGTQAPDIVVLSLERDTAYRPECLEIERWCLHSDVPLVAVDLGGADAETASQLSSDAYISLQDVPRRYVPCILTLIHAEQLTQEAPLAGPAAASRRPPIKALSGLRIFAVLLVVLHHFWPRVDPTRLGGPDFLLGGLERLAAGGYVGVSLFFVLSGFILTYNYAQGEPLDRASFWLARFARIYPMYVFSLMVALPELLHDTSVLLAKYPPVIGLMNGVAKAGMVLTLTQAWLPGAAQFWNGPAWSLSAEAFFYALFPFILSQGRIRSLSFRHAALGLVACCLLTLGLGLGMWLAHRSFPGGDLYAIVGMLPILRLPEFMAGILLARALRVLPVDSGGGKPAAAAVSILAILGFGLCNMVLVVPPDLRIAMNLPLAILLVGSLACGVGPVASFLALPAMVFMGDASFAMYLLHVPIGNRFLKLQGAETLGVAPVTFIGYVCFALFLAGLLHVSLETPMRALIRHLFGKERRAVTRRLKFDY